MTPATDDWSPRATADGSLTLVSARVGEACHGAVGAWTEARERYAVPCRLAQRAARGGVLRLLDVGTGLGWNLAAALDALAASAARLEVLSLEAHPGVIAAALDLWRAGTLAPPELAAPYGPLGRALALALADPCGARTAGVPLGPRGRLWLELGDARATLPARPAHERFDAVFLDPFSPRADPPLWEAPFLTEVARRLAPGGVLSTYSASYAVRARLAQAGLAVRRGPRVGAKAEGTLAARDRELPALAPRTGRRLAARLARPTPGARGADLRTP